MPAGLMRYYGAGHFHFLPCSCYRRLPLLDTPERRDLFIRILEETRQQYRFIVTGYVVMPEHFHLLMSEPQVGDPSKTMQVVKQRFAQNVAPRTAAAPRSRPVHIWEARFYDFNVWTEHKRIEKLRYMHRNPVKRGLVNEPQHWPWSSFRDYLYGELGPVKINDTEIMRMAALEPAL